MINQQIIDYIKQQLQQGVSSENIKNSLRTNGWAEADIEQAFNSLSAPLNSTPISPISRPKGVKVISVLYFLGSLLAFGFGVLAIFGANFFTQVLGAGFFGKFFAIGKIVFIALGILGISVGIGLWRYKNWARLVAVFLALVGIILSILSVLKGNVTNNIFNLAISSIIGGYLFFSPKVKSAFEPEKGAAVLNKKLLWTFIILLVVIVGLASAVGLRNAPSTIPTTIPIPTTSALTPEEKPQILGPKESYLKMKAEADNIKSYADFEAYVLKYGSKEQVAQLIANKKQIEALPQSFKDQIVALAKGPLSSEITTIQETINGNTATLNVQTTKPGLTGVITLVLEDNLWKLELESWKQTF